MSLIVTDDEKNPSDVVWGSRQRQDDVVISGADYYEDNVSQLTDLQQHQQQQEYSAPHYGKGTEYRSTWCLQLLEILELSWNLKLLPEILEISWNFVDAPRKIIFTARCYASAVLAMALCLSVRLSVRLSVTSRCSTKTAKRRITQTTPHDSPGTIVF